MLHLIKGRAGSGKTAKMREIISRMAVNGVSRPVLLVPEQFSFETERIMLEALGAKNLKNIDIYSFSRLAFSELQKTGLSNVKTADNGIKAAIMSEALMQLEGNLDIFSNVRHNSTALSPLVDFCKELKYCCIDSDTLTEKLENSSNLFLKNKLTELNLIRNSYEALLTQSYFDDTDAISIFTETALQNNFFKNKTLFIDGFRSFSKQELECLEAALSQCDDVYIALCADERPKKYSSLFFMKEFENKLRTIANKCNCAVDEVYCQQNSNGFAPDIARLERTLFSTDKIEKSVYNGDIVVALVEDSATVKTFYKENGHFRLQPENSTMEPIIVNEVKILGKVVGLFRTNI